jgi:MinD-like ATPase involved in chromosome partitioning or flagellar assembly
MPRIVAVHSFRGGTGKSNTTANLAVTLARQGQRVGVVDADIQSPGIHVLFGLDEETMDRSLNDYLWGQCPIQDTAYDVSASLKGEQGEPAVPSGGVYLIPSSIKAGEIARVLREGYDVELLTEGFRALIAGLGLDYLFIDTHPGLNEETLLSIAISDVSVLILRPDRQDYQGTAVTVEVARKLDVPQLLLLVNKVLPSIDFEALRQQVEQTYNTPVAGVLPLSDDVVQLASSDVFCLRYPDHPWTRAIQAVAAHLAGDS